MKRKLNEEDVPTPVISHDQKAANQSFERLDLDPRLLEAIAHQNFTVPTLVQSQVIPLAIEGKDILGRMARGHVGCTFLLTRSARAKTGSGKTAAYVLPILEAILRRKAVS